MTMEYTFDEAKTTVFEDGHYTVEHYNTLVINNPMQVTSVSETDDTPLHSYFLQRVVPTTIGYYVELGAFTVTGGAHSIQVDISVGETNFSVTKKYLLTIKYSLTSGAWTQVEPISSTGPYINNDFSLDINVTANVTSLRIRRTGTNTSAGTARIYLVDISRKNSEGFSFVESSLVGDSGVGGGGSIPSLETTSGGIPVGSIVAWIGGYFGLLNSGYTPILQITDTVIAANIFLNPKGWYVCDGSAPNLIDSPIWNASNRYLPNLTDSRFLMGAVSITSTANGGSNTLSDHTHTLAGNVVAESGHTHSSLGVTVAPESSHSHSISSMSIGGESAHTHTWGGHWSIENSSEFGNGDGDGLGNTFSDILTPPWGTGYWNTSSDPWFITYTNHEDPWHSHTVEDAYFAENRGSGGTFYGSKSGCDQDNALFTRSVTTGQSPHQHPFPLYSHRHWIRARGTSAGSNHGHSLLGSLGTGSSHAHGLTGSVSAGTSHTHSLTSGSVGSGSTPSLTDNRPQYFKTFMIVRVK